MRDLKGGRCERFAIPKKGYVYYIVDYTSPKVFNGLYYECLQTDQRIPAYVRPTHCICHFREYPKSLIYKIERFLGANDHIKDNI